MALGTRFQVLEAEPEAPKPKPTPSPTSEPRESAALAVTLLVLETFSKRVAAWLGGHTLPLTAFAIGVYLWLQVMAAPSINQLIGLGIYSVFALLVLLIRSQRNG